MTIAEKVSYIKGLAEGMKLDDSTNEGKVINAIIDVLGDIALNIEEIDSDLADVTDVVADIEESVYELEDEIYGDDCDCCDCDDDCCCDEEMYEITCPACDNTITADFDVISEGSIACPNCGETLEFDLSALEDCDCGCCDE
ncbi:MAG: hypothetical protein IJZ65_08355 [Ruminiclostridium sp.]|nr:hypothetical protein [Ruminiclostridium sp.]